MWSSRPVRDAIELQQLMMADARNPELKAITRAALARAYCELEETKRKLRMKPLPKAIDVGLDGKTKRSSRRGPTEPTEA